MSANRPTPSKLSSKYKKLVREARKAESPKPEEKSKDEDIIEISSEEEAELDNIEISRASSWTSITRRLPRRDSTILAGNITVPDTESEDDESEPILSKPKHQSNYNRNGQVHETNNLFARPVPPGAGKDKRTSKGSSTGRGGIKNKGRSRGVPAMTNLAEITEDEDEIMDTIDTDKDELITEDETDFYSCDDNNSLKGDNEVHQNSDSSQARLKNQSRSEDRETNASSLRLALSESDSNSMTQYHATPGIVLGQFKANNGIVLGQHQNLKDVEKTPTNSPVKMNQASTAKKAALLLSSKRQNLETPVRGRILAAGSSEEEETDSNTPILNNVNRRLRYTQKSKKGGSPIVVARSDNEDTPPPNLNIHKSKGLLSNSKMDLISSWLDKVSSSDTDTSRTFQQVTESEQVISRDQTTGFIMESSDSLTLTKTSIQRTSKAGCEENNTDANITEDLSNNESELVEKVTSQEILGSAVYNRVITNRVSSSSEMMSSERTSKARFSSSIGYSGGSESQRSSSKGISSESYGFNSSDRTSKAGLTASYDLSSGDDRSSKAGLGLTRNSSDEYGVMSEEIGAVGSSERTSKAGLSSGSSYGELNAGKWSNRASSELNSAEINSGRFSNRSSGQMDSAGIIKNINSEDMLSERTSKAGCSEGMLSERTSNSSPLEGLPSNRTSKEGRESFPTLHLPQKSSSDSPYCTAVSGSASGSSSGRHRPEDQVPCRSSDLTSWRSNSKTIHSADTNSQTNNSRPGSNAGNDEGASNMIPLSDLCTSNATVESTFRGNFVYGNDSVDVSVNTRQEPDKGAKSVKAKNVKNSSKPVSSTTKGKNTPKSKVTKATASEKSGKYNPYENQTIDNSVDAVRAWTSTIEREVRNVPPSVSQASESREKFTEGQKIVISSDEEDNFDNFLSTLKKDKRKVIKDNSDDGDFVVPDDQLDSSDYLSSPTMSLADKIRNKKAAERKKSTRVEDSDSESDDKPSKKIRDKQATKDKVKSPVLKSKVIVDTPDSSPNLVRPRRGTTNKKNYIIRSDSDSRTSSPSSGKGSSSGSQDVLRKPSVPLILSKSKKPQSPLIEKVPKPSTIKKPSQTKVTTTYKTSATSKSVAPKTKEQTPKLKITSKSKEFQTPNSKAPTEGSETFGTPRTLTFLSSLTMDTPSYRCHPEALKYTTGFKKKKEELSQRLYHLYNKEVFEGCLPADMEIKWNVRLTKTAGLCYSKRYKNKFGVETRSSRIELSAKVIDSADRLRDTLIHEMCHAASWIISGYRDGHGPQWKCWADKCMTRFPELPVIDRCHAYQIRTKFTYVCVSCSYSIGRHSKSLDTEKKVCGHCYGRFELVVNTKTSSNKENGSGVSSANSAPRTPNAFALFTKENYQKFRKPGTEHKDVMTILSQEFRKIKLEEASKPKK